MIFIIVVIFGVTFVTASNNATRFELTLKAIKQNNENILDVYSQQLRESAQTPSITSDNLQDVFNEAIDAHYKMMGSQATMAWLKSKNPTLDPKIYNKLLKLTNEGRARFEKSKLLMIDAKRAYITALDSIPIGMFMRLAGYPRINLGAPFSNTDDFNTD